MRTRTVIERVGENMGPIDWTHPTAVNMPPIWRDAEKNPDGFVFGDYARTIVEICMYDGWPYWKPTPAVCFIGPLKSAEWSFFNSYGVYPNSIRAKGTP